MEEIYQCVLKILYTMCIRRTEKCGDYEDLPSKCTTNDNYCYYYVKLSRLIYLFRILCYLFSLILRNKNAKSKSQSLMKNII